MKAKYLFPVMMAAAAAFTSCSDFLEEDPKGRIPVEGFFNSEANLTAAVNALYYNLQLSQCNSNTLIPQCQGDDVTSTTGSNKAAYLSADAFEDPTDTKGLSAIWNNNYNLIQAANAIIDNAQNTPVEQSIINEALGQAYFWRGVGYYNLVQVFGPLPLNLHNEADNNATPLSKVSDVYERIVSDLKSAVDCNLPGYYTAANKAIGNMNIYVTEQAAKSMLGVVYMSMAGFPLGQTERYSDAADVLKEVYDGVNNGKYRQALNASWDDVYNYGNNYNTEIVVGLCYKDVYGGWSNNDSQMSACHQFGSLSGWGDFLAERYFWSLYPEGPRKDNVYAKQIRMNIGECVDWWATLDGQPYDGTNACISEYRPMFIGFTVNADEGGAPLAEPYDYTKPYWPGMCINKSHQLIRYSEVLCWFAEAAGRSGKFTSEGMEALKKVQQRAYTTLPTVDAASLAEAAYREHGWEVAGNMYSIVTRRNDEFRMDRLKEAYDYRVGAQSATLVPKGTLTHSWNENDGAFTYTTTADVVVKENMEVTAAWQGNNSKYQMYPPTETEKNPAINVAAREALLN